MSLYNSTTSNRIPYWDNLKGILIIFVVFGHFLWGYKESTYTLFTECVCFIYLFHMPAFLFVSGYFSRSPNSLKLQSITKLLIAFLLLNFLMMPYAVLVEHMRLSITSLYYSSWYLWALVVYRITLPLMSRIPYIVPISILVSLSIGFWKEFDGVFAISKIIALYPFFISGAKSSTEGMESFIYFLKRKRFWVWLLIILIGALSLYTIHMGIIGMYDIRYAAYTRKLEIFKRFFIFSVAAAFICGLLSLTAKDITPFINKWGKNSLSLYATHRIFTLIFLLVFPITTVDSIYWIWIFVGTVVVLVTLGSDYVSYKFNVFLSFFLDSYFQKEEFKHRSVRVVGALSIPCMILGVIFIKGIPLRYMELIKSFLLGLN